jgi:hypothetical protein
MQDIVGPVRQKLYIQGASPSLSQPREQLHPAEGWKVKLATELRAAGFEFDANKVLA